MEGGVHYSLLFFSCGLGWWDGEEGGGGGGGGGLAVVVVMVVSGGGREESVDGEWYVLLSSGIWRKTYFDEKVRVTLFS